MAARIFYYLSTGIILIGLALAAYSPDLFQWETLEWVYQKWTFFLFSLILITSVILIYLIYWKAKNGILHSKSKTEIHLQESLNELVEDNQSLFSFLKAATESLGKQIETSKQNLSPEFFTACSTEYLKLTREFETSSEIFKSIPMTPEEDPKMNKINFKIYEYSEIINRHRKLSKNLEKLREDLTRLRNKVSR
ncbi:hypothetical protein B2G50_06830 [Leptospira interrogans serovar Canicola]|nr:hypothetical protein B2G50_06830 [Leptospira interrogans serovar Canicola]